MKKAFLLGIVSSIALFGLFFGVTTLVSGKTFAFEQFWKFWPYLTTLATGFGIQMFLLLRLHQKHCERGGRMVAVSGTTSAISMISCCSHYFLNFLPLLSGSGLSLLIGQYQTEIFLFGILINIASIFVLIRKLLNLSHL